MGYAFLADVVVAFHLAYVAYVVLGQLAIVGGLALRQQWVRNPWFRLTHLAAILIVAVEEFFRITCPLTTLEADLRAAAGQQAAEGTFVGRLLHDLLFFDSVDARLVSLMHVAFAALVLGTFFFAPPRFRRSKQGALPESNALATGIQGCAVRQ